MCTCTIICGINLCEDRLWVHVLYNCDSVSNTKKIYTLLNLMNYLQKLNRGKSDGGGLTSDHLILPPSSFTAWILCLLNCSSDMPVQPIPERNNKDYSLSTNYCGIALAQCFSKIIELQGEHLLSSSYNSARIINHMHWCVKGSFIPGQDASKAFDTCS